MQNEIQRLRSIIENSNDAIIAKNLDGIITDWNPAAEKLFGYLAEEAIGQPINMLAAPDRPNEMPAILAPLKRGGKVDHFQTVRKHKSGKLLPVSLTVSPILDEKGNVIGASKIVRDITGHAEEEARIKRYADDNVRLLLELNHRVGNNLAISTALLRRSLPKLDPKSRPVIEEVIDQIYALAGEHEERMLRDKEAILRG